MELLQHSRNGERGADRQHLRPPNGTARERMLHRGYDRALGADPEPLEELSELEVEDIRIHGVLHVLTTGDARRASYRICYPARSADCRSRAARICTRSFKCGCATRLKCVRTL